MILSSLFIKMANILEQDNIYVGGMVEDSPLSLRSLEHNNDITDIKLEDMTLNDYIYDNIYKASSIIDFLIHLNNSMFGDRKYDKVIYKKITATITDKYIIVTGLERKIMCTADKMAEIIYNTINNKNTNNYGSLMVNNVFIHKNIKSAIFENKLNISDIKEYIIKYAGIYPLDMPKYNKGVKASFIWNNNVGIIRDSYEFTYNMSEIYGFLNNIYTTLQYIQ